MYVDFFRNFYWKGLKHLEVLGPHSLIGNVVYNVVQVTVKVETVEHQFKHNTCKVFAEGLSYKICAS